MPASGWTPVTPRAECPYCRMDAVVEHSLPFRYGQALYACMMPPHYAGLYNETKLKGAMTLVAGEDAGDEDHMHGNESGVIICPVCGMVVTDRTHFVDIKNGSQRIYACSAHCAEQLYASPLSYVTRTEPLNVTVLLVCLCWFCSSVSYGSSLFVFFSQILYRRTFLQIETCKTHFFLVDFDCISQSTPYMFYPNKSNT